MPFFFFLFFLSFPFALALCCSIFAAVQWRSNTYSQDLPAAVACRCVLGRWANRFSSSLVALSLYSIIFCAFLFFALYSTNDTAAEVQLCAQWFALFCLAPPLLSVSLCLTRSSVHKVAVHLSVRREGSYRQAGERTPKVQVIVEASQTGCGALSFLLSVPLSFFFYFFSGVLCFCAQRNTFPFCPVFCTSQFYMENTEPQTHLTLPPLLHVLFPFTPRSRVPSFCVTTQPHNAWAIF